jgi:transposase
MTHDYKRHGTTTLFAALNGRVLGACMPRHRAREFLRSNASIRKLGRARCPPDRRQLRHAQDFKRWLRKHKRFHLHFTPTSSSWLNMVERFFAEITEKRIRRGVFRSVAELESAIVTYLEQRNPLPSPSSGPLLRGKSWKKSPARQALESVH